MPWQRVEKTDFGYAVQLPESWVEREVDLRNSPWETARFVDPVDRRHSVIVFRHPVGPRRAATDMAQGEPLFAEMARTFEILPV